MENDLKDSNLQTQFKRNLYFDYQLLSLDGLRDRVNLPRITNELLRERRSGSVPDRISSSIWSVANYVNGSDSVSKGLQGRLDYRDTLTALLMHLDRDNGTSIGVPRDKFTKYKKDILTKPTSRGRITALEDLLETLPEKTVKRLRAEQSSNSPQSSTDTFERNKARELFDDYGKTASSVIHRQSQLENFISSVNITESVNERKLEEARHLRMMGHHKEAKELLFGLVKDEIDGLRQRMTYHEDYNLRRKANEDFDKSGMATSLRDNNTSRSSLESVLEQSHKSGHPMSVDVAKSLLEKQADLAVVDLRKSVYEELLEQELIKRLPQRGVSPSKSAAIKELRDNYLDGQFLHLSAKEREDFSSMVVNAAMIAGPGGLSAMAGNATAVALTKMGLPRFLSSAAELGVTSIAFEAANSALNTPIQGSEAWNNFPEKVIENLGMFATLKAGQVFWDSTGLKLLTKMYGIDETKVVNGMSVQQIAKEGTILNAVGRFATEVSSLAHYQLGLQELGALVNGRPLGENVLNRVEQLHDDSLKQLLALKIGNSAVQPLLMRSLSYMGKRGAILIDRIRRFGNEPNQQILSPTNESSERANVSTEVTGNPDSSQAEIKAQIKTTTEKPATVIRTDVTTKEADTTQLQQGTEPSINVPPTAILKKLSMPKLTQGSSVLSEDVSPRDLEIPVKVATQERKIRDRRKEHKETKIERENRRTDPTGDPVHVVPAESQKTAIVDMPKLEVSSSVKTEIQPQREQQATLQRGSTSSAEIMDIFFNRFDFSARNPVQSFLRWERSLVDGGIDISHSPYQDIFGKMSTMARGGKMGEPALQNFRNLLSEIYAQRVMGQTSLREWKRETGGLLDVIKERSSGSEEIANEVVSNIANIFEIASRKNLMFGEHSSKDIIKGLSHLKELFEHGSPAADPLLRNVARFSLPVVIKGNGSTSTEINDQKSLDMYFYRLRGVLSEAGEVVKFAKRYNILGHNIGITEGKQNFYTKADGEKVIINTDGLLKGGKTEIDILAVDRGESGVTKPILVESKTSLQTFLDKNRSAIVRGQLDPNSQLYKHLMLVRNNGWSFMLSTAKDHFSDYLMVDFVKILRAVDNTSSLGGPQSSKLLLDSIQNTKLRRQIDDELQKSRRLELIRGGETVGNASETIKTGTND